MQTELTEMSLICRLPSVHSNSGKIKKTEKIYIYNIKIELLRAELF